MTGAGDRLEVVHRGLERLAEERGDITQEVLERYYSDQPGARESFRQHGLNDVHGLEARMVEESVYLLLRWVEDPPATKIDQATTIVHHNDTLAVGPRWYMCLIDAVLAILLETVRTPLAMGGPRPAGAADSTSSAAVRRRREDPWSVQPGAHALGTGRFSIMATSPS